MSDDGLLSRMGREKGELCRARLRDILIGEHLEVEWWKDGAADYSSHHCHCHNNLNNGASSTLASLGGGNNDDNAAWTASVIMALAPRQSGTLGGGKVLAQESSSSSSGGSSEKYKRELNFKKKSALERLIAVTAVMIQWIIGILCPLWRQAL